MLHIRFFFASTAILLAASLNSHQSIQIAGHSFFPVHSAVTDACTSYLESKGFEKIKFLQFAAGAFPANVRAFIVPPKKIIYMSSDVVQSIQQSVRVNGSMCAYDCFTLLHEIGHLDSLSSKIIDSEKTWHLYVVLTSLAEYEASLARYKDSLSFFYHTSYGYYGYYQRPKGDSLFVRAMDFLTISLLGAALYTYFVKIRPLKKLLFKHPDREFESYMRQYLEEKEADSFAFAHLSVEELQDLHAYFSHYNDEQIDEDSYYATPHEYCAAIQLELEKRAL
jgi:hypothetical protein